MTTHVTLTDVMVDELREQRARAARRVAALEMAIAQVGAFDPHVRDAILAKADEIEAAGGEAFLQLARAL